MESGSTLKIVYFGTPDFAVPTLERLATDERFGIELVVTQPDRPAGRGRKLSEPPVKEAARRLGLRVYQPETLRGEDFKRPIREIGADLFVVAAYGKIFGRGMLEMPNLGCVNLHASLLPRYRGASPATAAILCGDDCTGVTLMVMDTGLDTGDILAARLIDISHKLNTDTLLSLLANVAAELAQDALPRYAANEIAAQPQPTTGASIVRPLVRADGWIDWSRPAREVDRQVRAMWPWPRAWTTINEQPLQIHAAHVDSASEDALPGDVIQIARDCAVVCGSGSLVLDTVQPAGSRAMSGAALLAGRRVMPGDRLGIAGAPPTPPPYIEWLDSTGHIVATGCRS